MTVELKNTSGGKRAGDVEYFPSGRQTYLAPMPLPTSEHPFCPYISGYNETFLDFGGGEPNVFSYQIWLGGPFSCSCLTAFGFPLLAGFIFAILGSSAESIYYVIIDMFFATWRSAVGMWLLSSAICLFVWFQAHNLFTDRKSTRLNSSHITRSRMPSSA